MTEAIPLIVARDHRQSALCACHDPLLIVGVGYTLALNALRVIRARLRAWWALRTGVESGTDCPTDCRTRVADEPVLVPALDVGNCGFAVDKDSGVD